MFNLQVQALVKRHTFPQATDRMIDQGHLSCLCDFLNASDNTTFMTILLTVTPILFAYKLNITNDHTAFIINVKQQT